MKNRFNKIAVKIGSNVLTRADGTLDITQMSALVDQIAALHKRGVEIVLISSGAVASGKSVISINKKMDEVDKRQLFSAVGQAKLINHYWELFREHGIIVGQVLTTKENFSDRHHYLNQRNCMQTMLRNSVLPIVNENDTVSVQELMFTDNDELSGLIASMMDMEALIILSNVDGIYNGNPADANSHIISKITAKQDIDKFILPQKSTFGRGGMQTKINIAHRIAEQGIDVFIAGGRRENILLKLLDNGNTDEICTHFVAAANEVSSVKKWI
ncbi:MAG: glutamate 5-kinase, partial [Paludibacter sp.]|nr:glutamate 5-kinase [Paludibacter sp.]